LIISDERSAGGYSFQIAPRAHATVDRLATRYRQAAIQLWIMKRVVAAPDQGAANDYFPPEGVRGEPVSEAEFERALDSLESAGLITGIAAFGGEIVRPKLTPRGHDAFESGYSPLDWVSPQSGISSTIHHGDSHTMTITAGTVGAAQQGNGNTATVTQADGLDTAAFETAMSRIREALERAGLPQETRQAATDQLELIDETAKQGGARQRIHSFFHMFVAALPPALAADVSGLVTDALACIHA
jgi:hypothetical protein